MKPLIKRQVRRRPRESNESPAATPRKSSPDLQQSRVVVLCVMYPYAFSPQPPKPAANPTVRLPPGVASSRPSSEVIFYDPISSASRVADHNSGRPKKSKNRQNTREEAIEDVVRELELLLQRNQDHAK